MIKTTSPFVSSIVETSIRRERLNSVSTKFDTNGIR